LDPNVLTIGFARRFTEYKRPNLLLTDLARLDALLRNDKQPVQIVVAGKAHPADSQGKDMIGAWIELSRQSSHRRRVVFLADFDITLAQHLVQGVDVWINTPRRPWEACGTSGMKVLVNGGLNCSILDGWWDEAYRPDLGWAIGNIRGGDARLIDQQDADSLYTILEQQIIPEFYDRDVGGLPRAWLARIRSSMANLTPAFNSARMLRDYVETAYLPLVKRMRSRRIDDYNVAKELNGWARRVHRHWQSLHFGEPSVTGEKNEWQFSVPVFLGEITSDDVRVELFADAREEAPAEAIVLHREQAIPGAINGYIYAGSLTSTRSLEDYTLRIVPYHEAAMLPAELPLILWQR
jgi:starch phosphorylase